MTGEYENVNPYTSQKNKTHFDFRENVAYAGVHLPEGRVDRAAQ